MTFVIPLAVAGALAIIGFMASRKDSTAVPGKPGTPVLPPKGTTVKAPPAKAVPANSKSAPAGALPDGTTPNTGDNQTVHADDTFDEAVAKAIAAGDVNALIELAKLAEQKGLLTVAKSIRDEIARLQQTQNKPAAPIPTPVAPDKPPVDVVHNIPLIGASYIVKAGDTGEKIALAYTGNKSRWTELLAPTNPNKKRDPKFGIALYTGERINLPAPWPTGVAVLPAVIPPSAPTVIKQAIPPVAVPVHTYTVVAGDTGEKVAIKFVGDKSRWKELLKVNPTLASAQYGIALYTGHKINLPANWPAVPTNALPEPPGADPISLPAPKPVAAPSPVPQSDARTAAQELTDYLVSLGSLAGRYKEDRTKIKAWQSRLGASVDGSYGKGTATIIIQNGIVPVAPYYWSKTTATADKNAFLAMVKSYAAADPQRASQWNKLLADTIRS